jgi:hypothetical protein
MPNYREEWEEAAERCAAALDDGFASEEPQDARFRIVADAWASAMRKINPNFVKGRFGGKTFENLAPRELLSVHVEPPDMSFPVFCFRVRAAASVPLAPA